MKRAHSLNSLFVSKGRLAGLVHRRAFSDNSMFLYHGQPVSAQDAADIITHRLNWRRVILARKRDNDHRDGAIWRQLWAMIRGRL